jgi:2-keto-4-pentenoate hydratase/2-oxohepta-3-ene-1,7-dioic acid hydratase in catechol pathway
MKIICIGRNYAEHAKELDNPLPEKPIFFMKPDTALLIKNRPFYYPFFSDNIHFEVELVLRICKAGKNVQQKFAYKYYDAIGMGIDFTARDLQGECKTKGLPWEIAKGFDQSAPISNEFIPKEEFGDVDNINFRLDINGETVQHGNTKDLIFSFDHLISYLSQYMTLRVGDMIFTGTPEGVGPVKIGDKLEGFIEEKRMISFNIK